MKACVDGWSPGWQADEVAPVAIISSTSYFESLTKHRNAIASANQIEIMGSDDLTSVDDLMGGDPMVSGYAPHGGDHMVGGDPMVDGYVPHGRLLSLGRKLQ